MLVQLALGPFIVSQIGLHDYGFWALLLGIIQVTQIADGGLPYASAVDIAQARGSAENDRMRSTMRITMAALSGIGAVVVIAAALLAFLLPPSVMSGLPSDARTAIILTGVAVAMTMATNGFNAGPSGLERWELNAVTIATGQLAGAVVIVALLLVDDRVSVVAAGFAGGTAISAAVAAFQLRRLGLLSFRLRSGDRQTFRRLRGQGAHLQVVALASIVTAQADRFLLLPFTTLAFVGAFDLGARASQALRAFPVSALGPVMARVATINGRDGFEAVSAYYRRLLAYTTRYAIAPLTLMVGVLYPAVLTWLGTDYATSAAAAALLTLGTAANMSTAPGTATGNACGRAQLDRDYSLLTLGLKVLLSVALGLAFGPWGVIAATPIGLALSSATLVVRVNRWTETSILQTASQNAPAVRAVFAAAVIASISIVTTASLDPSSRLETAAIATTTLLVGSAFILDVPRLVARVRGVGTA